MALAEELCAKDGGAKTMQTKTKKITGGRKKSTRIKLYINMAIYKSVRPHILHKYLYDCSGNNKMLM